MGTSRSKTHHLNIQMLTPNNIMHYGLLAFAYNSVCCCEPGCDTRKRGGERERDNEGETLRGGCGAHKQSLCMPVRGN